MTTEMKSQETDARPPREADELDPASLAAIRQLLAAEETPAPSAPVERVAAPAPSQPEPAATRATPSVTALPPLAAPEPMHPAPKEAAATSRGPRAPGALDRVKARVTGYRPTPKHVIVAALALLVLLRPWLVVGTLLLSLFGLVVVFLVLGYDGFWKKAMGAARWYAGRRPDRAQHLHRKLDDFAMRWDAFLDRFPEGSVDALYLPDFGELATADARHGEALDRRLSTLGENGT